MSYLKKIIFKSSLIIIGLSISVIIVESYMRILGYLFYRYRVQNIQKNFSKEYIKILCVGDSWTEGVGADFGKDYPTQLQINFNNKMGLKKIKVFNKGLPGGNTYNALMMIKKSIKSIKPDIIILLVGTNNYSNFLGFNKSFNEKSIRLEIIDLIYGSRVYKLIKLSYSYFREKFKQKAPYYKFNSLINFKHIDESTDTKRFMQDYEYITYKHPFSGFDGALLELYLYTGEHAKGIKFFTRAAQKNPELLGYVPLLQNRKNFSERIYRWIIQDMREIALLTRNSKIDLIIMTYPMFHPFDNLYRSIAETDGIFLFDNNIIYKSEKGKNIFTEDMHHYNNKGYKILADGIYDLIINENMLNGY